MIDWFADRFKWFLLLGVILAVSGSYGAYRDYITPMLTVHGRYVLLEPYDDGMARIKYIQVVQVRKSCPFDVRQHVIDSAEFRHDLAPESDRPPLQIGTRESLRDIEVPDYLPDGPAVYTTRVFPKCNWLQKWLKPEQQLPPLKFTVERATTHQQEDGN